MISSAIDYVEKRKHLQIAGKVIKVEKTTEISQRFQNRRST